MKYVVWKDYKLAAADLKHIYQSATKEEALTVLEEFAECWDKLNTLFGYSSEIRQATYATNTIESLNSVI